jgi:hypothetical protein
MKINLDCLDKINNNLIDFYPIQFNEIAMNAKLSVKLKEKSVIISRSIGLYY